MRSRRHGDPSLIHKRGPKANLSTRSLFKDPSPRTQARLDRAIRLDRWLREEFGDDGYIEQAIADATRPNGSLNFSKLQTIMENRAVMLLARRRPEKPQPAP
jgi:hypothetical protein